jgi:hypothetical protein
MLMAPDPLMLLAKLLFLPETVIDPLSTIAFEKPV